MHIKKRILLAAPLAAAALLAMSGPVAGSGPGSSTNALPMQSPINITTSTVSQVSSPPVISVSYPTSSDVTVGYVRKDTTSPTGCTTRGSEETEEVDVPENVAWVTYQGVRYYLDQFHFHTRSEHTVNGRHAPLEQHLVHRSAAGKVLVIGVLLFPGSADEVDEVLADLPAECGPEVEIEHFNLRAVLPANLSTLRYQGSLTTAPFTEGVQWFLTIPQSVSQAGITSFQTVFPAGNARTTQPLNGRTLVADVTHHLNYP